MKSIIYARVSTDDQADRGYSLPSQLDLCRKYAERLGFSVVAEFADDCSGTIPFSQRPEGKKAVAMLKDRRANAIIAYQVDRLSRDIVDLLAQVRDWVRAGVQVHACDVGHVQSELDIVLVIKGWQGSDERKKIIERTSRGRNSKAIEGRVVGAGKPPYGYRYLFGPVGPTKKVVVALEIDEEEARIVRQIFDWYVKGERNENGDILPVAIMEICRRLQAMGTPIPSEKHFWKRRGGFWSPPIVYKILRSETYKGTWYWGKKIGKGGSGGKRAKSEQTAVSVPAIVDEFLWKAAQDKLDRSRSFSRRRSLREYLLRSLITCSCGRKMTGKYRAELKKVDDPRYYVCPTTYHTWKARHCGQTTIRAKWMEKTVWDFVKGVVQDPVLYEDYLRKAQHAEIEALAPKQADLEIVEKLLADCRLEAEQCASALVKAKGAVGRALESQMLQINARDEALTKRRDELMADLAKRRLTDSAVEAALRFRESYLMGTENPTFEAKRRVLELLGVTIKLDTTKFWVCFRAETCQLVSDLQTS